MGGWDRPGSTGGFFGSRNEFVGWNPWALGLSTWWCGLIDSGRVLSSSISVSWFAMQNGISRACVSYLQVPGVWESGTWISGSNIA